MRILGIDYGEKRIGLAISDELGLIAKPMPTLKIKTLADGISKLQKIIATQKASIVVIGLPLGLKGEETKQSIQIRYFADTLKSTNGTQIEFWNEAFSTKDAESTPKSKKKKTQLDSQAARIILQEFLDKRNEEKKHTVLLPKQNLNMI